MSREPVVVNPYRIVRKAGVEGYVVIDELNNTVRFLRKDDFMRVVREYFDKDLADDAVAIQGYGWKWEVSEYAEEADA